MEGGIPPLKMKVIEKKGVAGGAFHKCLRGQGIFDSKLSQFAAGRVPKWEELPGRGEAGGSQGNGRGAGEDGIRRIPMGSTQIPHKPEKSGTTAYR
jgi:hypothetical protein